MNQIAIEYHRVRTKIKVPGMRFCIGPYTCVVCGGSIYYCRALVWRDGDALRFAHASVEDCRAVVSTKEELR